MNSNLALQGRLLRYKAVCFVIPNSDSSMSISQRTLRETKELQSKLMVLKREKERLLDENDYLKELTAHQKQTIQRAKTAVHASMTDKKLKLHKGVLRATKRLQELHSQIK